jgi:hypothetical protein
MVIAPRLGPFDYPSRTGPSAKRNLARRRPLEAELVARNLDRFTRDQPSIADELRLPHWDQPTKLAWPPPQTPLAVLAVQGMAAAVDHPGADWWQQRDERLRKLQTK